MSVPCPPNPDNHHRTVAPVGKHQASVGHERELVEQLLADDPAAWRGFCLRYGRLITRSVSRILARFGGLMGPEDVKEICASFYLKLLSNDKHKLRSFEPGRGSCLASWVGMLASQTAYDYLRSSRRERRLGSSLELELASLQAPDPYEVCARREQAELVASLVAEFSEKDQEFMALYYGQGLDPEQVAERMDISVRTVYSKKHKIRSKLEALMTN